MSLDFTMRTMFIKKKTLVLILGGFVLLNLILYNTIFKEDPDDLDFVDPSSDSFARVSIEDARKLLESNGPAAWPSFRGYNNKYANSEDNPLDVDLLERIQIGQDVLRSTTLHTKTEKRHAWKFEKIIHQMWKSDSIPQQTAPWVGKWLELNPDWTLMFWTDETQEEFVKLYYPILYESYQSWTYPVQRADMFRYIALYAFGGVYVDLDVEPLRPLEPVRDWGSCILGREPDAQVFVLYPPLASPANNWTMTGNAFMACRSHHPFLFYLISRTVQNSPLVRKTPCPLEKTILCSGPWMLSFAYTYYKSSLGDLGRKKGLTERRSDVLCPSYEYFLPTYDPSRVNKLRWNCLWLRSFGNRRQKEICRREVATSYRNTPETVSYTTHRWFNSYHSQFLGFVNVFDVANVTKWTLATDGDFVLCSSQACR